MRRFQLSRIKRANLPFIAAEVESIMREAPGAPTPPRVRKPRRNLKLELADAEIRRCQYCGSWHTNINQLCNWCTENSYPTIDDIERTR